MAHDPAIRQVGEDALIRRLLPLMTVNDGLITGPGDDCAVARGARGADLLLKTDCVVEGMHFLSGTEPGTDRQEGSGARRIGHRSHGGRAAPCAGHPADSRGPPRLPGGRHLYGHAAPGGTIRHQPGGRGKLRPAVRRADHQRGPDGEVRKGRPSCAAPPMRAT